LFYATALGVALFDQATKLLAASHLPVGASVPLAGGLVHIEPTRNPGGAFGVLQAYGGLITFVTALVVLLIVLAHRRGLDLPRLGWFALALQLGGAVGNLVDRIRLGYVYDFISLRVWPVFNLADSAITVGIVMLLYYLVFGSRSHARQEACEQPSER
jgi:signal peptidase II